MKINYKINILAITAIAAFALSVNSCKEVGPSGLDLTNGKHNTLLDTTYVESPAQTAETKNVLIEEFTGVSCINCPAGRVIVDNLVSANAGRVIAVALHSTAEPVSLDDAPPHFKQVLGTADAQTIVDAFGDPGFRPEGSIDRTVHNNIFSNNSIYDDRSNWGGYTAAQLGVATPVNMVLTKNYVDATHLLTIDVELHYTAAQADSDKLTIFLTQDSIVTSQLLADNSEDSTYVHNGVLRTAVTSPLGDKINATLVSGTVVRRIYSYTISNPLWKPENMHIVAFVHKYQNTDNSILQTKTISVK